MVNHLKGKAKRWCNTNGHPYFAWQARYHDHIIRDLKSFNRNSNYIANNVYHWADYENNEAGIISEKKSGSENRRVECAVCRNTPRRVPTKTTITLPFWKGFLLRLFI